MRQQSLTVAIEKFLRDRSRPRRTLLSAAQLESRGLDPARLRSNWRIAHESAGRLTAICILQAGDDRKALFEIIECTSTCAEIVGSDPGALPVLVFCTKVPFSTSRYLWTIPNTEFALLEPGRGFRPLALRSTPDKHGGASRKPALKGPAKSPRLSTTDASLPVPRQPDEKLRTRGTFTTPVNRASQLDRASIARSSPEGTRAKAADCDNPEKHRPVPDPVPKSAIRHRWYDLVCPACTAPIGLENLRIDEHVNPRTLERCDHVGRGAWDPLLPKKPALRTTCPGCRQRVDFDAKSTAIRPHRISSGSKKFCRWSHRPAPNPGRVKVPVVLRSSPNPAAEVQRTAKPVKKSKAKKATKAEKANMPGQCDTKYPFRQNYDGPSTSVWAFNGGSPGSR